MKDNILLLIVNCKLATISCKAMKDAYRCDEETHEDVCKNIEDCINKEEPCSYEDPFGESYEYSYSCYREPCSCYEKPYIFGESCCEVLYGDISYEEGIHD